MRILRLRITLLLVLFAPLWSRAQFYQGSNMEFGKNRVQYKDFTWFYYPGQNFDVYYYIGGEKLAQYVLMSSERQLPEVEAFFNYKLDDRLQILSYLNLREFRQSNIGITGDEQFNIGGSTKIMGNKIFTYFEGDHQKLDLQIRENIARVIFNQMMYGGDWKDVLKSSTLLSIPYWYQEGLIAFAAEGQTNESETFILDLVRFGKFKSFNHFEGHEAKLLGQSFWSYINEVYGSTVIPNILYMAQAGRSIDSGFLYILGISLEDLSKDFIRFYQDKAASSREAIPLETPMPSKKEDKAAYKQWKKEQKYLGDLKIKYKKKFKYSQFKLSPDGEHLAYLTNELGQYRIWIYNFATGRKKCILKKDHKLDRIMDETYPLLTWHPSGKSLTYTYEKNDDPWIAHYSLEDKKHQRKQLFTLEKVLDMQYSKDGKKIIMSAANRGQSDLFLYQVIGNNQEQLTNDIWDDLHPRFVDNDTRVIFASNRPDDTLRTKVEIDTYDTKKDIYLFPLEHRSNTLERLTNTPQYDESHPAQYGTKLYTYLSDNNGYYNRYLSTIDSTISAIDTAIHYRYFTTTHVLSAFKRNLHEYDFNAGSGKYVTHVYRLLQPRVILSSKDNDHFSNFIEENAIPDSKGVAEYHGMLILSQDTAFVGEIDIRDYVFEDERKPYTHEKETNKTQGPSSTVGNKGELVSGPFQLPASRNYRLNFATDYVVTQVNNSFSNQFYQNVTGPTSITPGISAFTQFGASDLFEDYKLIGGFRFSFDLSSIDFAASFEDLKSRWDKKYVFLRQSSRESSGPQGTEVSRQHTNMFIYQMKYPFSEVLALRFSGIGRMDKRVRQSNDLFSLMEPNTYSYNIGLKLELVFDNSIAKGLNLYNGTRAKAWAERYQRPDNFSKRSDVNVLGFDVRNYKKLHRDIILATRLSGTTTFGYKSIIHYLGGVDNWLRQKVDYTFDNTDTAKYAYQAFAGPMRGFWVNARSGNNVAMASAEVRFPVFKYFMRKPIKSDFIENFQIVTFLDAGCAWTGSNPYSEVNVFNKIVFEKNPLLITIENNREPIIYGYGFGLRSRILGYFVRADWAWGVDDGQVLPRVFYLSLNLDF